jgi:sugar lactone lactonase YvrE
VSVNVRIHIVALALAFAGCSSASNDLGVAPGTGTVYGTISNNSGALAGVTVVVTPVGQTALPAVTTNNAGRYRVAGIDVSLSGSGSVAVSNLPTNCTPPAAASFDGLRAGDSVDVTISVSCTGSVTTGSIVGKVTSSLGGGIANARVTVTPQGASALAAVTTTTNGSYTVGSVPPGNGSVAVSSLPTNCTIPSAIAYHSLTAGKADTVNVTVTCTPPVGSLLVNVSAPNGVTANVLVTGPNGYSKSLSATQTLSNLAPGTYTVSASHAVVSDPIVLTVDTAAITSATKAVTAGATAKDSVTYAARPGTGALWVANNAGSHAFVDYTSAQLSTSGAPTPNLSSSTAAAGASSSAIAFDANGNLWAIAGNSNLLVKYTPSQLTSGTPAATITINDANGVQVNAIAFDGNGNLWLANYGPCDIDELSASQLASASGSVTITPALTLNGCATSATVSGPNALAFDGNGNLWVADIDSADVYEYPASALTATGAATVEPVMQTRPGITVQYLAFDGGGNLWVSGSNQVVRLTPAELSTGGSSSPVDVTPSRTITVSGATFEGLAFDNSGDLWLVDNGNAAVVELSASQLASAGTATPTTVVAASSGSLNAPWSLAFDPMPDNLPQPVLPPSLARRRK